MVHPSQQSYHSAARRPPATLSLSQNGRTRTVTVRPWIAGVTLATLAAVSFCTLGGAGYLAWRDDLMGGAFKHQARIEAEYEDRLAALRSEVDRVSSRHVAATQGVQEQIAILLDRQSAIEQSQSALDDLVQRARKNGVETGRAGGLPRSRPIGPAEPASTLQAPLASAGSSATLYGSVRGSIPAAAEADGEPTAPARLKPLIAGVQSSLDAVQDWNSAALETLSRATEDKAAGIAAALAPLGLRASAPEGGPYIPVAGLPFAERAALLGRSLDDLAALRRSASALPLGQPLEASYVSSGFGYREDPFLHRPSLHPGIDLVAGLGTIVHATAPGVVVSAGWDGGYGQMVEVRHAGGLSTRYGHLSQILVQAGATVATGTPLGLVGSTGRSTGPHLHYETRRNDAPVDPQPYLSAGRAL